MYFEDFTGCLNISGKAYQDLTEPISCNCGPSEASGMSLGGSAIVSCPSHMFDSYTQVYHLDEQGDGTSGEYEDSCGGTGGQGDGGLNVNWVPTQATGVWHKANSFDGNDYITLPSDSIPNNHPITVSFWAKINGRFLDRVFFSRGATATAEGWSLIIGHNPNNQILASCKVVGTSGWITYNLKGLSVLTANCWYHFALVWNPGNSLSIYINGNFERKVNVSETTLVPSTQGNYLGRVDNQKFCLGTMQEVRIAPVVRTEDWIETEYASLCGSSSLYSVGSIESPDYE